MDYDIARNKENVSEKTKFLARVYGYMALALLISTVAALSPRFSPSMLAIVARGWLPLVILELVIVFVLSSMIRKMSTATASLCFIAYSAINGLTLSTIFFAYRLPSIINIFVTCTLMFLALSIYGVSTKRDLSSFARFGLSLLFGIIIAGVVNIFLRSTMLDFIASIIGVLVFSGLTAYDTQRLMYTANHADGQEAYKRVAIIVALNLYLDFINLFLYLLRIFGRSRD